MKKLINKLRERKRELDEILTEFHISDVKRRSQNLREAVETGALKYYLMITGGAGAGLVYSGLTHDNETTAGIGYGLLGMTALYSLLTHGIPALRNLRNRNRQSPHQENNSQQENI